MSRLSPDFSAFDRVCEVVGSRRQNTLAAYFGVQQSSISDAKRRGHIPATWLLTLMTKDRINPDWITSGQGQRCLILAATAPRPPCGERLLGQLTAPDPPQWLVETLAEGLCSTCPEPECSSDQRPRCYAAFAQQAARVCRRVRLLLDAERRTEDVPT